MKNYNNKALWLVFFAYLFVNAVLIMYAEPGVHLSKGADADSWYRPAISILKHGSFVMLNSPE
ncbi:hypothetical protein HOL24_05675, partial [bacterium]|nr:hypothetical protein [bacterium]